MFCAQTSNSLITQDCAVSDFAATKPKSAFNSKSTVMPLPMDTLAQNLIAKLSQSHTITFFNLENL